MQLLLKSTYVKFMKNVDAAVCLIKWKLKLVRQMISSAIISRFQTKNNRYPTVDATRGAMN